jgi:multiple antibiotic resistance protein
MEIIFSAVITLFLVMDPFGNIPLFITSLKKVAPERRTRVIARELLIALATMLVFLFLGSKALSLLGIAQYSMSIGGGLVLFIISVDLVFSKTQDDDSSSPAKDEEPFVVPLAIPLIAGPASLSMLLILSSGPGGALYTFIAVIIASVINAVVLMLSFPISNLLGKRGLIAVEKLTGMLLVVMSVNMVMNGVADFMKTY